MKVTIWKLNNPFKAVVANEEWLTIDRFTPSYLADFAIKASVDFQLGRIYIAGSIRGLGSTIYSHDAGFIVRVEKDFSINSSCFTEFN